MTPRRAIAALLARIRPARGRHVQIPSEDTVVFPGIPPDPGTAGPPVSPSMMTVFDVAPVRARPYAQERIPDDPAEAVTVLRRMFPGYDIGCVHGIWRAFPLTSPAMLLEALSAAELAELIRGSPDAR